MSVFLLLQFIKLKLFQNFKQSIKIYTMKLRVKGLSLLDDLGNTRTSDGRRIKPRLIYRSSYLIKLEKEAELTLTNKYHIHHCVDFRTDEEVTNFPELEESVIHYYHFPMLENHENKMITKENRLGVLKEMSKENGGAKQGMIRFYGLLATSPKAQKAYRNFIDVLLKAKDDEGVVFHCTQGKDRTGIAMMIILSILGVDRKTIEKKYMAYNSLRWNFRFWVSIGMILVKSPKLALNLDRIIGTRRAYIEATYHAIEENYQSVDNYIRNVIGVSEEEINLLKNKFLH